MKKLGLAVAIFFGAILLTSTVLIAIPGPMPTLNTDPNVTLTGTPADNYPDDQRDQFCGVGDAKSTTYVTEYKIPTPCTNPLAITTDYDGNVWFVQSNTGVVTKFDPTTELFTEFDNPTWPDGSRSMMWGMDYAPDGSIWFTDDFFDAIWKFSPFDGSYGLLGYKQGDMDVLPQKIQVFGSDILFNDFTGGNLVILTPLEGNATLSIIPQILNGSVTSDFATDMEKNIWFTSWAFPDSGVLAKFDYRSYSDTQLNPDTSLQEYLDIVELPEDAISINGVDIHESGNVWLADTSNSFFFVFDPMTGMFTKFITSDPPPSTYGNATGIIKSPVSRPYWIETTDDGNIVFNEQNANRLAVFDPVEESLVEYLVPSKNPNWADCGEMEDCGISQIFDFAVYGDKIWFTEWVENNIGVVDTSVDLPFAVDLDTDFISIATGSSANVTFTLVSQTLQDLSDLSLTAVTSDASLTVSVNRPPNFQMSTDGQMTVNAMISIDEAANSGQYKVLLGASTHEVSLGKFITVFVP